MDLLEMILRDHKPVIGTKDITDKYDVTHNTAREWMGRLVKQGWVEKAKIGRRWIYWPTAHGWMAFAEQSATADEYAFIAGMMPVQPLEDEIDEE